MIFKKMPSASVLALLVSCSTLLPAAAQGLQPGWRFNPPPGITFPAVAVPRPVIAVRVNAPASSVFVRQVVAFDSSERSGTIIIDTRAHFLYLVMGDGKALRYGIGVARAGFEWSGTHQVTRKAEWPSWTPPAEMLERQPHLPRFMEGGLHNPLGARALYLGSTLYRIHGTSEPWSIGQDVSSGCIRMTNEDVIDLYDRVKIYTKVVVLS